MEESFSIPPEERGDSELDPRIQLELEKLNTATSEINKLELELDESNTTFRMLLNEATRRLKGLAARLGNSVDKARPYHEAAEAASKARTACQRAAVQYQRASEIHAAAKETVALAEQRFKSKQHEWQFDNAWQEMLNHATIKVMDAENQKAESGREHHKKAQLFNAAETKMQHLEDQFRKHIIKSRSYFEEKLLCQEQLATQKERIEQLQNDVARAKERYARSLRTLEAISEEIHRKRRALYGDSEEPPTGPREPGVGAEKDNCTDFSLELQRHDLDLRRTECSTPDSCIEDSNGLEELRRRVRRLAARPLEGGGSAGDSSWEDELNSTVQRLDQMLLAREQQARDRERRALTSSQSVHSSLDKLSDPFYQAAIARSHSSHDNISNSYFPQTSFSIINSDSIQQKSSPAHSLPAQTYHDQSYITSSSDSDYKILTENQSIKNDQTETISSPRKTPEIDKFNSLRTPLCLSVTNLQDLMPLDSEIELRNYSDKYVPFTYQVTFDQEFSLPKSPIKVKNESFTEPNNSKLTEINELPSYNASEPISNSVKLVKNEKLKTDLPLANETSVIINSQQGNPNGISDKSPEMTKDAQVVVSSVEYQQESQLPLHVKLTEKDLKSDTEVVKDNSEI